MMMAYGVCAFIVKYMHLCDIGVCVSFKYRKSFVRGVHSIHRFKNKKYIYPNKRKIGNRVDSRAKMEEIEPKVYMRDTIGNISKILRYLSWDYAQEQLKKLTLRWDSYTINQVLKTHPPMEKAWLFFNWASHLKGFKHDQFTYTTMLDIFGEAGRISSMKYVFQQMQEKGIKIDAVTYTSIMHWLSKYGDIEGSLGTWEEMKTKGCHPTVVSYTAFLKVLFDNNRLDEATKIFKEMLASGCSPNCHTYTVLMEYLTGAGKFKAALEILRKMQEAGVQPDKAMCNILVQKCSSAGETWAMSQILQYMKENSLVLRHPVYLEALESLKIAGESDGLLREVNPHLSSVGISKEGISESKETATDVHSIIDQEIALHLLAKKNFTALEHLLNDMIYKNTQLNPELISKIVLVNCANSRPTGALLAFEYSIKMGIKIERTAYLALIGLCSRTNSLPKVMEFVEDMVRAGISLGTYLATILIYRLGCAQMLTSAVRIFNSLSDDHKNIATYTALMAAYFCSGDVDKGLETFENMRRNGIPATPGTYKVLFIGLEEAGRARELEIYRKEKKSLQTNCHPQKIVFMEESLCDLIFA